MFELSRRVAASLSLVVLGFGAVGCASGEEEASPQDAVGAATGAGGQGTGTGGGSATSGPGGGGVGGMGGAGAAGGGSGGVGGMDCPDVACSVSCPEGYWPELDGCPLCACAPPALALIVNGGATPTQFLSLQTEASMLIGGIDRWVFDFTWSYDDPNAADEAVVVTSSVRLMKLGPMYEPTTLAATWFHPENSGMPLEAYGGVYTLYGFGIITEDLTTVSGWLSIRRVVDQFEGGVWLVMEPTDGVGPTVEAHGPFSVPVPM